MSRHFNYELDERRIRILLKENTLQYSEDVWSEYLEKTKPLSKAAKLPSLKTPSFAINKATLLTIVFVVLVGSFTLLVAKFVDFSSTRSNSEVLREVKPEPENYKITKPAKVITKKEEPKPIIKDTVTAIVTNSVPATASSVSVAANSAPSPVDMPKPAQANDGENNKESLSNANNGASVSNVQQKTPKKKRKKEVETLESKPLTTEIPLTSPSEPELELK